MNRKLAATGLAAGAIALGTVAGSGVDAAAAHGTHHAAAAKTSFTIGEVDGHEAVVLHGAVNDGGKDVTKGQKDVFRLSKGTITVKHPNKQLTAKFHPNPVTCYATFTLTGKYKIIRGTGAYKGITGHGKYKGKGQDYAHQKKGGGCAFNAQARAEILTIKGHGPAKY